MLLDSRLNLNKYLENIFRKVKSGICIIPKLWHALSRSALLTIYKPFVLPCLAYDDKICDQAYKEPLQLKLEFHQHNNTRFATTRAVIGSSRARVYQELETLCKTSWLCKMSLFYKMNKNKFPSDLFRLLPTTNMHIARNLKNLKGITFKCSFFKKKFFHLW